MSSSHGDGNICDEHNRVDRHVQGFKTFESNEAPRKALRTKTGSRTGLFLARESGIGQFYRLLALIIGGEGKSLFLQRLDITALQWVRPTQRYG